MDRRWTLGRLPIDSASILVKPHIRIVEEAPLAEVLALSERIPPSRLVSDRRKVKVMQAGLRSATSHVRGDYDQLQVFDQEWRSGVYFATRSGIELLTSRASEMWYDADSYLEISARLKRTLSHTGGAEALTQGADAALGRSLLDLATHILRVLRAAALDSTRSKI